MSDFLVLGTQPATTLPTTVDETAARLMATVDGTDVELLELAGGFARDLTTGRLMLGGVELGDTGHRSIAPAAGGHALTNMYLRRVGGLVFAAWQQVSGPGAIGTADQWNDLFDLPAGFEARVDTNVVGFNATEFHRYNFTSTAIRFWGALEMNNAGFSLTYGTEADWPATLPGSAI